MTSIFGPRGSRPYFFACAGQALERVRGIPGVKQVPGGVRAPADAAGVVAGYLGVEAPQLPIPATYTPPGLARYNALGLSPALRQYQKEGAAFLAVRSYAMLCDDMRLGKSFEALTCTVLEDLKRVVVVCPAQARPVWRSEVFKWIKDASVYVLRGRAADELRIYCPACRGIRKAERCKVCPRGVGFTTINGRDECVKVLAELPEYSFVIVNYDLLIPQRASDARGVLSTREDLPGWAPTLGAGQFELALFDESQLLRGLAPAKAKAGLSRRERSRDLARNIPRVWLLTGTPIYGFTRDLWGQLDVASGGLYGHQQWDFLRRYCDFHETEYGWEANGSGPWAEELRARLTQVLLKRTREQVNAQLPPKVRQVVRVEPDETVSLPKSLPSGAALTKALAATCKAKLPAVTDGVVAELAERGKVVLFCLLRQNAERVHAALKKELSSKEHGVKMREANAEIWMAHGEQTPEVRSAYAEKFKEHDGAAVFISTIDAVQVAISLRGARSVHFVDLHHSPAALMQAEDRPYEPGTQGLTVVYYLVVGSVDELVADIVLPKMRTIDENFKSQQTTGALQALQNDVEDLSLDDMVAKLTAHLDEPSEEGEVRSVRTW